MWIEVGWSRRPQMTLSSILISPIRPVATKSIGRGLFGDEHLRVERLLVARRQPHLISPSLGCAVPSWMGRDAENDALAVDLIGRVTSWPALSENDCAVRRGWRGARAYHRQQRRSERHGPQADADCPCHVRRLQGLAAPAYTRAPILASLDRHSTAAADINNVMLTIFYQAVGSARLTQ